MKLTFFGGINEIGGNKILLEDQDTRLFLDFGKSYHNAAKYFEEFLNPRVVQGLKDYLELDLLPRREGIYRKDLITILNKDGENGLSYVSPRVDAILLSHGHMDHAGYTSFLDPTIPVYLSPQTLAVLKAFRISRPHNLENEVTEISLRDQEDYRKRKREQRKFCLVQDQEPFLVKKLKITPLYVDHSIPGATMYLIHTSKGNILYSGDFRLSEIPVKRQKEIVSFLKKAKIKIFICEGTRVESDKILREKEVYQKALAEVKKTKGLVVVDYSIADTTRFQTLLQIARASGRILALPYNYFNYIAFLKKEGLFQDDLKEVYLYTKKKLHLKEWERNLLKGYSSCSAEDIRKHKDKYMLVLNFYQIQELIDIQPGKDSYYLRAITEPHSEEMEISEQRFINWVEHFQMKGMEEIILSTGEKQKVFSRTHISGHISGKELAQFIKKIKPEIIIPVHTEHPELFKNLHKNVKIVQKNEMVQF